MTVLIRAELRPRLARPHGLWGFKMLEFEGLSAERVLLWGR